MRHHPWNDLFAIEKEISCDAHLRDTIRCVRAEANKLDLSAKPRLSLAGLIAKQFKYLAWKIWLFQGMVLAVFCAVFFMTCRVSIDFWTGTVLMKFLCLSSVAVVISSLPLLKRATQYRMFELEQSTHFAVIGNLLSQLLFIGIGDLCMLTVLALLVGKYGLTISVISLSLVVPFLTAAVCCLMLWTRVDPAVFQTTGAVLCLLSALVCYGLIDKSSVLIPPARFCIFTGYCLSCLGLLYCECRRLWLYRPTEKMLP